MLIEDEYLKNGPIDIDDYLIDAKTNKVLKVFILFQIFIFYSNISFQYIIFSAKS
jgi:hypothetical protein